MTAHRRRPELEWHDVKAEKNVRKHGVSFDERIRIISSRPATARERKHYEEE
jgi:uncharacterized DUF497 family protein